MQTALNVWKLRVLPANSLFFFSARLIVANYFIVLLSQKNQFSDHAQLLGANISMFLESLDRKNKSISLLVRAKYPLHPVESQFLTWH